MSMLLTIDLHFDGDVTRAAIAGAVVETASFAALETIGGNIEIDASGVWRFNSMGVRLWTHAMTALSERAELAFVACSRAVIQQAGMTTSFFGSGRVESFYVPMLCARCDREVDHLMSTSKYRSLDALPPLRCPACAEPMHLDELESVYLKFLNEPEGDRPQGLRDEL